MRLFRALLLFLGFCPLLHAAYIDPASSSTILQILAPVFVVLSLLGGFLRRVIRRLLRRGTEIGGNDPDKKDN